MAISIFAHVQDRTCARSRERDSATNTRERKKAADQFGISSEGVVIFV